MWPAASIIALTATLSTIGHIPVVGIMLIFGIDKFMSECQGAGQLHRQRGGHPVRREVEPAEQLDVVPRPRAVFAGKDVEPLFDPSEDLDVNPYDPTDHELVRANTGAQLANSPEPSRQATRVPTEQTPAQ